MVCVTLQLTVTCNVSNDSCEKITLLSRWSGTFNNRQAVQTLHTLKRVASAWLGEHQERPSAPINRITELHIVYYYLLIYLITNTNRISSPNTQLPLLHPRLHHCQKQSHLQS